MVAVTIMSGRAGEPPQGIQKQFLIVPRVGDCVQIARSPTYDELYAQVTQVVHLAAENGNEAKVFVLVNPGNQ